MTAISKDTYNTLKNFKELVEEINGQFFYVVFGGIAVDAFVGKVTSFHSKLMR